MTEHGRHDPTQSGPSPEGQTLYEALGGAEGVRESVDDLYRRVLADEDLAPFFENVPMDRLRRMQFEFIASMVDGPVNYTGAELADVHLNRGITVKHFTKFCRHFADALEARGVDPQAVDQVLGRLALYSDPITGSTNVDG